MIILGLGAGHGQEDARRDELRFVGAQDLAQHGLPVRGAVDEIGKGPLELRLVALREARRVQVEAAAASLPTHVEARLELVVQAPRLHRAQHGLVELERRVARGLDRLLADVGRVHDREAVPLKGRGVRRDGVVAGALRGGGDEAVPLAVRGDAPLRRAPAPKLGPVGRVPLVVRLARRPVVLAPAQGHDGPAVGAPDAAVVDRRRAADVRLCAQRVEEPRLGVADVLEAVLLAAADVAGAPALCRRGVLVLAAALRHCFWQLK